MRLEVYTTSDKPKNGIVPQTFGTPTSGQDFVPIPTFDAVRRRFLAVKARQMRDSPDLPSFEEAADLKSIGLAHKGPGNTDGKGST